MDIGGNNMTIGEKIYTLRNEAHMTQEELAGRMGVSRQSVSKWESGASVPELEKLRMLADLFGIPIGELINPDEAAKAAEAKAKKAELKNQMKNGTSQQNGAGFQQTGTGFQQTGTGFQQTGTGFQQADSATEQETTGSEQKNAGNGSEDDSWEEFSAGNGHRDADQAAFYEEDNANQQQVDFLNKQIKNLKTASIIQSICIIGLTAAIIINSVTMVGMNRRIRVANDTANEAQDAAYQALNNRVTYVTSDSDYTSRDYPFEDAYEEIESFDADAHTMQVKFTVIPQSTTEETDISLILTDENGQNTEIALEDNSSRYTAQAELPIINYPDALIVMDDGDTRQTYQTYFDELACLEDELLAPLSVHTDLTQVDYKVNKQTLNGDGIIYLTIYQDSDTYYPVSHLAESYELDQLTVRICAVQDNEDETIGERVLWEASLDSDQLKALADPENTVELDLSLAINDYNGEMLHLEVTLTNHYLQEEKTFTSADMLDYGTDSTSQGFLLEENDTGLVWIY